MSFYRLETRYLPARDADAARFEFTLVNGTTETLRDFRLCYGALTRIADGARVEGAGLVRRIANHHAFAAPGGCEVPPGGVWKFSVTGLSHLPRHRLDGPKSAYLECGGEVLPVTVGDLALEGGEDSGALRVLPPGAVRVPLSILPWPNEVEIADFRPAAPFCPEPDAAAEDIAAMQGVGALSQRLFPLGPAPFRTDVHPGNIRVGFVRAEMAGEGYRLSFGEEGVQLAFGDPAGRSYGLTVLAQMHHAASTRPDLFSLPARGEIVDAPRHGWRGAHLDVVRHFWTGAQVRRLLDILAWSRMNALQLHLTDDEGWRLEIAGLPELTEVGSRRGPGCALAGQLGFMDRVYEGHYSQSEMRGIIAHASSLHIQIVPEIDVPGHSTAALAARPDLRDPAEPEDSYRSIQGYPNNALNPALPQTYAFLETVFEEVAGLFPSPFIHVGADEVDSAAWQRSPRARALMEERGIADTMGLQAYFLRRVQEMLRGLGKRFAGWDEVSHGGGVDPEGALVVAWQKPEVIRHLVGMGYEVIASPGQAYYLDMAQASGWNEPGGSWAGTVTPRDSYEYEAVAGLTAAEASRVKGVQACIWSEHLTTPAHFNHMVFPRLPGVAEAGWTRPENKSWERFAALSRVVPQL